MGNPVRSQGSMTSYANDVTMQETHINTGYWERVSLVHKLAVGQEVVVLSHDSSGRKYIQGLRGKGKFTN